MIVFFKCLFIHKHIRYLRLKSTDSVEIEKAFQMVEDGRVPAQLEAKQPSQPHPQCSRFEFTGHADLCSLHSHLLPALLLSPECQIRVASAFKAPSQTPLPVGSQFWSLASLRDLFLGRARFCRSGHDCASFAVVLASSTNTSSHCHSSPVAGSGLYPHQFSTLVILIL